MEYLATPGKTVIFLIVKSDNSLSVQKEIYDQIARIFKDDSYLEEFFIQYVENCGLVTPFKVWVESVSNLGYIDWDDEPILRGFFGSGQMHGDRQGEISVEMSHHRCR
jgi:hypothetical protein